MGTRKSVIVEQDAGPLAAVIAGVNLHDTKLLAQMIDAIVIPCPDPETVFQHLCLDKGYDNPTGKAACAGAGYVPHIRRIGEEKLDTWGKRRIPLAWLQKWVSTSHLAPVSTLELAPPLSDLRLTLSALVEREARSREECPEWSSSSRSGAIGRERDCRSMRWRSVMGFIVGR